MNMTENRTWERDMPISFYEAMNDIRSDQGPPDLLSRSLQNAIALEKQVRTQGEEDVVNLARGEHETKRSPARVRRHMQIVASVACLAAVVMLALFFTSEGIAFAQIQERLNAIRSAKFRYRQVVSTQETKDLVSDSASIAVSTRQDGNTMIEMPDGRRIITSLQRGKRLEVNPDEKTANVSHIHQLSDSHDIVEQLRSLDKSSKALPLAKRTIGGELCAGFRIEQPDGTLLMWVSPKTQLPVRVERIVEIREGANSPSESIESFEDMVFDVPLNDELFSLDPPAGYAVTESGKPRASLAEVFREKLIIAPKIGLGPLRFGMSENEVLELLGTPDDVITRVPMVPNADEVGEVDGKKRPPGGELIVLTQLRVLTYSGLGISLTFEVSAGLKGITCRTQVPITSEILLPGQTMEGIRLGSTSDELIGAYGEPDGIRHPDGSEKPPRKVHASWQYAKLGYVFSLDEDGKVSSIGFDDGKPSRLRFEWRVPVSK
jgi:outer membrane lipoprotein-sorting protein